jgi:hypothetical protein
MDCRTCLTAVGDDARYCHRCGAAIVRSTQNESRAGRGSHVTRALLADAPPPVETVARRLEDEGWAINGPAVARLSRRRAAPPRELTPLPTDEGLSADLFAALLAGGPSPVAGRRGPFGRLLAIGADG